MNRHMKVLIGVIILWFIFSFPANTFAQEGRGTGRLQGTVCDKEKKPVAGVKLTLEYLQFTNKVTSVSESDGSWAILGLGKGMVKITAEKEGFINQTVGPIDVSGASRNPKVNIILLKPTDSEVAEVDKGAQSRDMFTKGSALFKEGKYEAALALFEDFRKQQPDLYQIGINIGNCYLELKRYEEAITEYKTVIDKIIAATPDIKGNSEVARLYASIGDVYMRQDNLKDAEEYFKKSLEIDPADHALAYNVAEIMFAAGKTEEAINYYKLAIQIKPDWSKSYMQLGYAYLNKGDSAAAIENLKKFLELEPNAPEAEGIKEVIESLK